MAIMRILPLLAVLSLGLFAREAQAGECLEGDQIYVKAVEKHARGAKLDPAAKDEAFHCLAAYAGCELGNRNNKWAGKRGLQCLKRARKFKYKARLSKACGKLAKGTADEAPLCVMILARIGVQEAEGLDVFAALRKLKDPKPRTFAALGDARAIPYLIEEYKRSLLEQAAMKKKDRWKAAELTDYRRNVINALWHFASPESKAFLESVVLEAKDKDIVKRAQSSLERIAAAP